MENGHKNSSRMSGNKKTRYRKIKMIKSSVDSWRLHQASNTLIDSCSHEVISSMINLSRGISLLVGAPHFGPVTLSVNKQLRSLIQCHKWDDTAACAHEKSFSYFQFLINTVYIRRSETNVYSLHLYQFTVVSTDGATRHWNCRAKRLFSAG